MSDIERAVAAFLEDADDVFDEYDRGYVDADAALRQLRSHVADLREERAEN